MRLRTLHLAVLSAIALGLGPVDPAAACNVPVFRFAVEAWAPETFRVYVLHRGTLSADEQRLASELAAQGYQSGEEGEPVAGEQTLANFVCEVIDLDKPAADAAGLPAGLLARWRREEHAGLPRIVVYSPATQAVGGDLSASLTPSPLWSGPLTNGVARQMLQSPARREISKRLLAGQSAVWLLLESGDRKKDDAAAELLAKQLAVLPHTLELPPGELEEDRAGRPQVKASIPLRIEFSLLRVARDDAAEALLVKTLLASEKDLADSTEPMAFPIFGRGRVLWALVGAGINPEVMLNSGQYLTGACSCEVKRQNPGSDLLMAADWESMFDDSQPRRELPLPSLAAVDSALVAGSKDVTADPPRQASTATGAVDAMAVSSARSNSREVAAWQSSESIASFAESDADPLAAVRNGTANEWTGNPLLQNLVWVALAGAMIVVVGTIIVLGRSRG